MELILLEKVQNLGDLGDRVSVKSGYGRNYLMPQGKAVPATRENIERFEARREELLARADKRMAAAMARLEALEGVKAEFSVNAGADGKLYGSIGPREIAATLTELGYAIEKSEVIMGEGPLRYIGEFEVSIQLHADVKGVITAVIHPDEQSASAMQYMQEEEALDDAADNEAEDTGMGEETLRTETDSESPAEPESEPGETVNEEDSRESSE